MTRRPLFPGIIVLILLAAGGAVGQNVGRGRGGGPAEPPPPAPRWPDGRINLGPPPGEAGMWSGNGRLIRNPDSYEPNNAGVRNARIGVEDVPFQPWALALTNYHHANFLKDEPHTACKPSGGPRQFITPYGFEIVDLPEMERIYIFDIGGPHSYRIVYMDGRPHPENPHPSYYGHSIGRWEGDTLVIDTVGFNDRFWTNRDGFPHTEQLRLTEKITRVDFNTLDYEVTFDDPGAFTAPWTSGFVNQWQTGDEMWEYICQDNNLSRDSMTALDGEAEGVVRIAP
jgi:hypothetical protein